MKWLLLKYNTPAPESAGKGVKGLLIREGGEDSSWVQNVIRRPITFKLLVYTYIAYVVSIQFVIYHFCCEMLRNERCYEAMQSKGMNSSPPFPHRLCIPRQSHVF